MNARTTRSAATFLMLLALLLPTLVLVGCDDSNDPYVIRTESREWYESKTGEKVKSQQTLKVDDGMSESHRMMANMIMIRNGLDPDTTTGEIYLTKITTEGGQEAAMVSVNGSKYK